MKKILLIGVFAFLFIGVQAQSKHEKIRAAKTAYISQNLDLTPDQAERFWPLYNEYSQKRRGLRKEKRQLQRSSQALSTDDQQLLANMNRIEEIKIQEVTLDKNYREKFLMILSPQQVMALYRSEQEFLKILKDRIKNN